MMTALMYKKPDDHIKFLETCLERAKEDPKIRWHSFIEPLPPIPKENGKIQSEKTGQPGIMKIERTPTFAKDECVLPPIKTENELGVTSQNDANSLAEKVFQEHMSNDLTAKSDDIDTLNNPVVEESRPWYADYTEKKVDTSALQGKPIVFVLGKNSFCKYSEINFHTIKAFLRCCLLSILANV